MTPDPNRPLDPAEARHAIKSRVADILETQASATLEPGKFGAGLPKINWKGAIHGLDAVLEEYLPKVGPLLPAQVNAIALIIAKTVDLTDKAINGA